MRTKQEIAFDSRLLYMDFWMTFVGWLRTWFRVLLALPNSFLIANRPPMVLVMLQLLAWEGFILYLLLIRKFQSFGAIRFRIGFGINCLPLRILMVQLLTVILNWQVQLLRMTSWPRLQTSGKEPLITPMTILPLFTGKEKEQLQHLVRQLFFSDSKLSTNVSFAMFPSVIISQVPLILWLISCRGVGISLMRKFCLILTYIIHRKNYGGYVP